MQDLQKIVIEVLKKDDRFVSQEWDLLRNTIREQAEKLDENLIGLLLDDEKTREVFFIKIKDVIVFDSGKFIRFVNNKEFLPDSYTSFKNKIGLTNARWEFLSDSNEVVLSFPYKDGVLAWGQDKEDSKRDEVFYNEILGSDDIDRLLDEKVFTNAKRIDKDGEHNIEKFTRDENGTIKDNLIIKWNNLLALHSLESNFAGKVKLIYIDPPYNTASDSNTFAYNNTFNHSTWLTFMKNRLEVAKQFLREDGFIAITIDHSELFYVWLLWDEIFGRDNRVGIVTIVHKPEWRNQEKFFGTSNEFMLVYAKNKKFADFERVILDKSIAENFCEEDDNGKFRLKNFIRLTDWKYSLRENKEHFYYPIYVSPDLTQFSLSKESSYFEVFPITEKGVERTWKTTPATFMKLANEKSIVVEKQDHGIVLYEKLRENQVIKTHWIKKEYHAYHFGTKLLEEILGSKEFSFPKSLYAVIDTLKLMTSWDDIILDFFWGSWTTAHAVIELNKEDNGNRRFIMVEQMNYINTVTYPRVKKVIQKNNSNENFIYIELKRDNQNYIAKIQKSERSEELMRIYEEIKESGFVNYTIDIKSIDTNIDEFGKLSIEDQKKFLIELLDKNMLYVNMSEIDDTKNGVSDEEKKINRDFYNVK